MYRLTEIISNFFDDDKASATWAASLIALVGMFALDDEAAKMVAMAVVAGIFGLNGAGKK